MPFNIFIWRDYLLQCSTSCDVCSSGADLAYVQCHRWRRCELKVFLSADPASMSNSYSFQKSSFHLCNGACVVNEDPDDDMSGNDNVITFVPFIKWSKFHTYKSNYLFKDKKYWKILFADETTLPPSPFFSMGFIFASAQQGDFSINSF